MVGQRSPLCLRLIILLSGCVLFLFLVFSRRRSPVSVSSRGVVGGIVPHHLLASPLIANFFQQFSNQSPKVVVILAPNHQERGSSKVLTSLSNWPTEFGDVAPETVTVKSLVEQGLAKIDESALSQEQSLHDTLPFVKRYLPQAKIVPLILKRHLSEAEAEMLSNGLSGVLSEEMILISSVDFSHYLTKAEANKNDELTLELMRKHDYQRILTLSNDYLDSPPAIVVLLMTMDKIGRKDFEVLQHANSADFSSSDYQRTTSYFTITFK